jgi:hypothetical protein
MAKHENFFINEDGTENSSEFDLNSELNEPNKTDKVKKRIVRLNQTFDPKHESFFINEDGSEGRSNFNFNSERGKLKKSLDRLKSMSVQEFTFYKKWEELKQEGVVKIASHAHITHKRIWKPTDIKDEEMTIKEIQNLDPVVEFVGDGSSRYEDWMNLRLFCHTMEFNQNPGRFLRFIIFDRTSKKYLGVLSVASDVISITDRDKYIGWNSENRLTDKRLAHTAIGSCIMATQPFGYNFLGGKLIACLATSKVVRDKWEESYNQKLVGMTTTSLYGSFSMYNNIKWWHKCGTSSGKILIKPDQTCYDIWHQWIKEEMTEKYNKAMTQKEGVSGPVTAAKLRILSMIMNACDIKQKDYVHGYERGVYYSCFYENTKEFLQNKIKENELVMKPLISGDAKNILDWWKPKAIERYRKLFDEDNIKNSTLFYDSMVDMTYEQSKSKFFADVGKGK